MNTWTTAEMIKVMKAKSGKRGRWGILAFYFLDAVDQGRLPSTGKSHLSLRTFSTWKCHTWALPSVCTCSSLGALTGGPVWG